MSDAPTRDSVRPPAPRPKDDETLVVTLDDLRALTRELLWLVDDLDDPEPIEEFSLERPTRDRSGS